MPSYKHALMLLLTIGSIAAAPPVRAGLPPAAHAPPAEIVCAREASPLEVLAAREIRRYIYLRTGELLSIVNDPDAAADAIVVARQDRKTPIDFQGQLKPGQYRLETTRRGGRRQLAVIGGDDVGTLYGAYRLIERLGVRFYLHGDTVPDRRVPFALPELSETGRPLFDVRGINPFHDFAEGPDWWSADDYQAHVSQLAKLRMNFIGLHCYPEGGVGPEPLVWIGLREDCDDRGRVSFSYPAAWCNTQLDQWGYQPTSTTAFAAGTAQLFERDNYGHDINLGHLPLPRTPEGGNEVFNRTAELLDGVFTHARRLGVKTCIGTETKLTIPKPVRERLAAKGLNPDDPATVRELYKGMFSRIARSHPLDYYWLWTPEGWTWNDVKDAEVKAVEADLQLALEALFAVDAPFTLATCGWVLGPPKDRTGFDKTLPKAAPLSCINRKVGHSPVEPDFAKISGRPLWAIPWMENDPNMVAPQLWVGRMRADAADARRYGCTGLIGIHWRTKILELNVAALAAAGWSQPWDKTAAAAPGPLGPSGGKLASFKQAIADTEDDPVYQKVRYGMAGYRLQIPNGVYAVTLQFCEPAHDAADKRVFGVELQGERVIKSLDVFERVGKDRALDFRFADVTVSDNLLRIDFVKIVENPCIAGIVVEGQAAAADQFPARAFSRKINCGGGAHQDYQAELEAASADAATTAAEHRGMPAEDFYLDWARANFGDGAARPAAEIFVREDGRGMHEPSEWKKGPGGIVVNAKPWEEVGKRYAFVKELEDLRARVEGRGELARYDYWLQTFRGMRTMAELGCTRGQLDAVMKQLEKEKDAAKRKQLARASALPLRLRAARLWERMLREQLAAVETPGEMGTLANLEQHSRRKLKFLSQHDEALAKALGEPLPPEIALANNYQGPPRIIVPTRRSQVAEGETLKLKVILLSELPPDRAALHWRRLGQGPFRPIKLERLARGVHTVALPPAKGLALEYYVETETAGEKLRWPATAPELCQTVVVTPKPK